LVITDKNKANSFKLGPPFAFKTLIDLQP